MATKGPKVEKFSEAGDKKRFVEYTISENFGGDASELVDAVLDVYREASREMTSNRGSPIASLGKPRAEVIDSYQDFAQVDFANGSMKYAEVKAYFEDGDLKLKVSVDGEMIGSRGSTSWGKPVLLGRARREFSRAVPESYGRSKPSYEGFDDALYLVTREAVGKYCEMHIGERGG